MTSSPRLGVALGGISIALWVVFFVAVVATPAEAGANIGAGLLGLLAVPSSIASAALLIGSTRSTLPRAAGAASIALLALVVLLAWGYAAPDEVLIGLLLAAVASLGSSVFLVARDHRGR